MKSRISPTIVFSISPLIFFIIFLHSSFSHSHSINTRQNLEIVIGGEAPPPETPYCPEPTPPPPPPPEECPPPSPPPPPPPPPKSPPPPPPPPKSPPPPPPTLPRPRPQPPKPKPSPPPFSPFHLTPELQRAVAVIQRFRNTIQDDPFHVTDTWNGRICSDRTKYKGFICDTTISDGKTRVALVNFNGFRLRGKPRRPLALRNFLDGLTDLIVFHANSNNFTGGVPSVTNLPSLFELDLSNNKLSGAFPPQVLAATNLTFLDLRFNSLAGKLPPAVFTLDLDVLFLNNNKFTGEIPATIGKTPSLYLTLANNQFTGGIPATIGQTSNTLLEILLLGNKISGCLPYQIGFLRKTSVFDASVNRITGPIPHSFGCLESMQYLNMSMNELYGAVPETLCRIRGLVKLTLSYNYITQVGPECRKLIAKKVLDMSMNCVLDLPNQRSKETCEDFFLRQQSCPDPESMNKVPCKVDYSESEKVERKLLAVEPPRTYVALEMHV